MARVTGPLMSISASGTIAKAITFGKWKGRAWVRQHFTPENPKTPKQINVRLALTLLIAEWQGEIQATWDGWNAYAVPFKMAGVNKYVSKGMDAYIVQHGSATTPVSVSVVGVAPADVWTWTV